MTSDAFRLPAVSAPWGRQKVGRVAEGSLLHDNGITAARLGLALCVVVSHSFAFTDRPEPLAAQLGHELNFGTLAVLGFFSLSGWLLAGSRQRSGRLPFLRNRALRIYPAFWLALVFAALIGWAFGGTGAVEYVASNMALLLPGSRPSMAPAFDGTSLNGSLWTLAPEVICYIALAATPRRWLRPVAIGLVAVLAGSWLFVSGISEGLALLVLYPMAFWVGVAARGLQTRWWTAGLAAAAFALGLIPIACILAAYAALSLMHLPLRTGRDLSYGTYLFAFPIGLALAELGLPTYAVMAGTIAVVLPLAFASWTWVEEPALRLRHLGRRAAETEQSRSSRLIAAELPR